MKKLVCLLLVFSFLVLTACSPKDEKGASSALEESTALDNTSAAEEQISVPDISGMTADEAEAALTAAGFAVKRKDKPNDDIPEGDVIGTDLKQDKTYKKGTTAWLYISSGVSLATQMLTYKRSALVESRPVLDVGANSDYAPINYKYMKACWLSQLDMQEVYRNGGVQRDEADFRQKIVAVFNALWNQGFNTVFVQLRPYGDSFYPSAYFCPSTYVTGSFAIDFKYDPLAIMVEEAHKVGLSFHGWINPMRCMDAFDLSQINVSYGIREFEQKGLLDDYVINIKGKLYLNPGREEVRKLIINGATEIVRYYDVDGIHLDDYFYPTTATTFDEKAYKEQSVYTTVRAFRYASLNALIGGLYLGVKAENPNVIFGISPAGNIDNLSGMYVDIATWLSQPGYVDYIMPQIYWGMKNKNFAFDKLYSRWKSYIKVPSIRLIPGMTLSEAVKGSGGTSDFSEWNNNRNVLETCLKYAMTTGGCTGFSIFTLSNIVNPSNGEQALPAKEEMDNLMDYASSYKNELIKNKK